MSESFSEAPEEFAGMTATECCAACTAQRCLITGIAICGHPNKGGGLPVTLQNDAKAVARFERAKKVLARRLT